MNDDLTREGYDPVLQPFLHADNKTAAETSLAELINTHADPVIDRIVKAKMRVSLDAANGERENQDAIDLASDLRTTLISELRSIQLGERHKPIASFRDYVAVKTYSACADYFREQNPRRWRLKNLLRHQLRQNARLALWKVDNNYWFAGLSEWKDRQNVGPQMRPLPSAELIREHLLLNKNRNAAFEFLTFIFQHQQQPVQFERLVTLAAEVWRITDVPTHSIDDLQHHDLPAVVDLAPPVDRHLEQTAYLEKLWAEVCELPLLQRRALLLNLRDAQGGSAIFFLPQLQIASQKQIAATLEMDESEFETIWTKLPMEDSAIAERLNITRQQVINLRKTARERLSRRMKTSTP